MKVAIIEERRRAFDNADLVLKVQRCIAGEFGHLESGSVPIALLQT
jgi:hypothetical protein